MSILYLCGGTFFFLLCEAKAKSRPKRDSLDGLKDSVSQKNMLAGLIRLIDSGFKVPDQGRTFDTDQSAYRACDKESSAYFPFFDQQLVENYDCKVRESYTDAYAKMEAYAKYYLNADSEEKMRWLGQALLTLLDDDKMIDDSEILFYCDGGITKKQILSLNHICIPSLMLALWHYIVVFRPHNKLGRPTFEKWNSPAGEKGDKWIFVSDIGKTYPRDVRFDFMPEAEAKKIAASDEHQDASSNTATMEPAPKQEAIQDQTLNNSGRIYNQHAEKIVNIEHVETLYI